MLLRLRSSLSVVIVSAGLLLTGSGCQSRTSTGQAEATPAPAPASASADTTNRPDNDALIQFSLITALAAGGYGDGTPLRDLVAAGDMGIGTFDQLEGEMILLDGQMFQALSDRSIRKPDLSTTTPFAVVTRFEEDGRIDKLSAESLEELDTFLDKTLSRLNSPYALRIDGHFDQLTLRSVPAQKAPYPPLVEVVATQTVWEQKDVKGTLLGFRCPSWIGAINVAGYHWHFLSEDKLIGGHVLGCQFKDALFRFDECQSVVIQLPGSKDFDKFNVNSVGKDDIDVIERQRAKP